MISLTYTGSINLCVLCVFVVPSTPSPAGLYLRIHFTHQIQKSQRVSGLMMRNLVSGLLMRNPLSGLY
ncbi:MAG: hypothetical protein EWV85_08595 [Microcystis aeruginosa Ma_QC_C_20070703_M131]|uniref:Uncharacterized protein n=1 Tax=Microcystis aeruginosa Ma_QC_C_20070703_M131 TaxID=2486263 RepID=A0A551Y4V2_MICAE|nr:MAG: hypothetical protein EWV85_08595 [Microcystis aeruginosa Ma_QC_C_20070703_M131]